MDSLCYGNSSEYGSFDGLGKCFFTKILSRLSAVNTGSRHFFF